MRRERVRFLVFRDDGLWIRLSINAAHCTWVQPSDISLTVDLSCVLDSQKYSVRPTEDRLKWLWNSNVMASK